MGFAAVLESRAKIKKKLIGEGGLVEDKRTRSFSKIES